MSCSPRSRSKESATTASSAVEDRTIPFISINNLYTQIRNLPADEDTLVITGVSPTAFQTLEQRRTEKNQRYRLRLYDPATRIMMVTRRTQAHERLAWKIDMKLYVELHRMGLEDDWANIGAATLSSGGSKGEADAAGAPRFRSYLWPTLAIEAGVSSSLPLLRTKMRWWFDVSNDQVKLVILSKLDKNTQTIELELYRRQSRQAQPTLLQKITITRDASDPVIQHVANGPLVVPFELMMDRAPAQGERDLILSNLELEIYAQIAWECF